MSYTYNLYQSLLRQDINRDIFQKPVFDIYFQEQRYQIICKEKKKWGVIFVRFQLLGIHSDILQKSNATILKKEILKRANVFYAWRLYIPVYIQLWCIDILHETKVNELKLHEQDCIDEFQIIKNISNNQKEELGLKQSKKHNLPDSTIVINLNKTKEDLRADISKNTKEKIKKAEKLIISSKFLVLSSTIEANYDDFYDLYKKTGDNKWFGVVTPSMRERLKRDAIARWYSKLFIIRNEAWNLVSGAFCIQDGDVLIYLYGANDRSVGNLGISQYLHRYIIQHAKEIWLKWYDFLGASWLGLENDWLAKVTQFKMWFGGEKLEYAGSRDLVLNKLAYWVYTS
jgi:lipid II:glycine glycyltransferase (peptidoglycan interpeptide bridge formation enzyme)